MDKFKEDFYKILLNKENFYMRQYYSNFHKKEIYLAIKELTNGIYCVLISEEENEDIDSLEAFEYIKSFCKPFSLNIIIVSNGEYKYTNDSSVGNRLIINRENNEVVKCDDSCIPLRQIFESITQRNVNTIENKKEDYFKYKIFTLILMGINLGIFLLTAFESGDILDIDSRVLLKYGAKVNILIEQGQVWRLLTCAFLHGGLIHILCNMYSLYIIGPEIQQIYGTTRYLIIYAFSCLLSSLMSYFMSPYLSVGASGGIFGLMGALLAFAIIERHRIQKKYISSLLQIIAINLFIGLSVENIDNFAHLGGLIGGISAGYIAYKLSDKKHKNL